MKPIDRFAGVMAAALLLIIVSAFVIVRSGHAHISGQEPSLEKSIFIVTNAVTLTGFEQPVNVDDYRPLGQATIFVLIIAGSLFTLLIGSLTLKRLLGLPNKDWQLIQITLFIYLIVTLLGAGSLMRPGMTLTAALFQAVSAFGNCGLMLGPTPDIASWQMHAVLLPLAFIGALGIPVILDVISGITQRRRLRNHTWIVLGTSALLYLAGTALILAMEYPDQDHLQQMLIRSSAQSLNSRTLGLPLSVMNTLMPATQWVVFALMIVGGSPGGTAGGLKTTTLAVLVRDSLRAAGGKTVSRAFSLASSWLLLYLLALLIVMILLSMMEPQMPGEHNVWLSISALSNVGESHAPVSIPGGGMFVLSGAMLFGRFVPLIFLWLAARADKPESNLIE